MSDTNYGDISPRVGVHSVKEHLEHAEPILVLQKFGQHKEIPKNKGQDVKFRRPVPFAPATTPLTEGVTPAAQQMAYEDVTGTVKQYGAYSRITDVIQDTHEDPVLKDINQLNGEQAAETTETLLYGAMKGGTNVFYAAGGDSARSDVNDPISLGRQRAIVRFLKKQRGKKHTSMLSGSVKIGTKPIEAAYIAFCHTDVENDIRALPGFTPVAEYGSGSALCPEEIGTVEDVRYITSPLLDPFIGAGSVTLNGMVSDGGTNVDVYPVIYTAKHSYGCCPLKGFNAIKPMILNPGVARSSDPLGQRGTAGWKTWFLGIRLNEFWMARLEVGVSDV